MRRRLYLMRHAAVSYLDENGEPTAPDVVPLTPEGRNQARLAAEELRGIVFDRVITSELPRTVETARIVAPDIEPEPWPALREIRPPERRGDVSENEAAATFTQAFAGELPREARFLGSGETIGSLVDRVVPAIQELAADTSWDTVLAVLHGAVNRAILTYALTGSRRFFGDFEQAPACINVLDMGEDRWIVRTVNFVPYDPLSTRSRLTTMEELWAEYVNARGDRGSGTRRS
jgi:broad specificity phosphatase PhoE